MGRKMERKKKIAENYQIINLKGRSLALGKKPTKTISKRYLLNIVHMYLDQHYKYVQGTQHKR